MWNWSVLLRLPAGQTRVKTSGPRISHIAHAAEMTENEVRLQTVPKTFVQIVCQFIAFIDIALQSLAGFNFTKF